MSSCLLQAVHTHWQYKKRFIHENSYIQPQPNPQNKYSLQETHSQIDEHQNRV